MTIYSLDYSFLSFKPVHCPMSSYNFCFLTFIQVSQEAGKVVWYSHFFKNFPQLVVIYTKALVSSMKQMFFWNFLAFSIIQQMLTIWSLVPLPFLNPVCTSGSAQFTYHWNLAWSIMSIIFLACDMSAIIWKFEHPLGLEWKLIFSIPVVTAEFSKLLAYWVQHFHSIIF